MKYIISSRRRMLMVVIDLAIFAGCYYAAFLLRMEDWTLRGVAPAFWQTLAFAVFSGFLGMYLSGVYMGVWRYVSIRDLMKILRGTLYASGMLVALVVFASGLRGYPRSVFFINAVLVVLGVTGVRVSRRVQIEMLDPARAGKGKRVLVVGAGDAADDLIRELLRNPKIDLVPVGLVDDNPEKRGTELRGVKVLGTIADIPRVVGESAAEEILIAIASATGGQMRRIIGSCLEARIPYRTLPGVGDILDGKVQVSQLRTVDVEDLLRRAPVRLDRAAIAADLAGKRVLVTGAGGSIGSEICRQVARYNPEQIVMVDHSENSLFYVEEQFARTSAHVPVRAVIADITFRARIEALMREVRPHVVFHAAAHKHVFLMERNFWEAFRNNVSGTRVVAQAAAAAGSRKFVMVSSDKAVNPTSVMGLSKRIAELVVQGAGEMARVASEDGGTEFTAVRFGNVMGSDGSVIPLWRRQIRAGGPVTVTHPDVVRYFMTVSEAVQLVLQAGAMGKGGEIFLLEMGEPVKVLDLARQVIQLSGKEPGVDVEIRFIGLRPGEKLYEELITKGEGVVPTSHEKIMVLRTEAGGPGRETARLIGELEALVEKCAPKEEILALARRVVPEYQKDHAGGTA